MLSKGLVNFLWALKQDNRRSRDMRVSHFLCDTNLIFSNLIARSYEIPYQTNENIFLSTNVGISYQMKIRPHANLLFL